MSTLDERWRGQADRGRYAERPRKIPPKGWKDVLVRVKREVSADRIGLVAGGVAYYAMLALFPMMVAAISLYGLFTTPEALESQIEALSTMLPEEARTIISEQLRSIVSSSSGGLTIGAIAGILVALYSATKGTDALISSVGLAYEEEESRGFFELKGLSFGLTLGGLVGALLAFSLVAIVPAVLNVFGLGSLGRTVAELVRWPLLVVLFMGALGIIYRYAPDRRPARWSWVSPGAIVATVLWIAASFGFSFYVSRFGNYEATYGSIAAVVVLLLWLWISAYVVLLGAEINAEVEHQTSHDSTIGPEKPMGQRGAVVADTVGRASTRDEKRPARSEAPDRRGDRGIRGERPGASRRETGEGYDYDGHDPFDLRDRSDHRPDRPDRPDRPPRPAH